MKALANVHLSNVQAVYSGAEGQLWELLMGEQIHIGGLRSSLDLAERAGIKEGERGVDLCCATGAGMRFLARFKKVARMMGVDATPHMLALGAQRGNAEGLQKQISFLQADVCRTGLPSGEADFVWGEDAWCYVEDKPALIAEAARLLRSGGRIVFTDWMEGGGLTDAEAERYLGFMKFPSVLTLDDYAHLLRANGCTVRVAHDTGRFASHVPLYLSMLEGQLAYDALKIIGFNTAMAEGLLAEMRFIESLAREGKILQGLVVAEKSV